MSSLKKPYHFPFAAYPAVRLVLLFAGGIVLDRLVGLSIRWWVAVFLSLSLIYILVEYVYQKTIRFAAYDLAILAYLAMIVTFGGTWHNLLDDQRIPVESKVLSKYTWQTLTFSGEVQHIKQTSSGGWQFDVGVDSTMFKSQQAWMRRYKLRAVLHSKKPLKFPQIKLGSHITFKATPYPLKGKRNPHEFDYKRYLASNDIYVQAGIKQLTSVDRPRKVFSWLTLRRHVLAAIDNNFSPQTAPLAKALLMGDKSELAPKQKLAFSRAGLSHILAVSGLHVGFILIPFWLAIPLFWTMKYGKEIGFVLLVGFLYFYAGLTGFSASVTRASLAGGFLMYAHLFHKPRDARNLTAVAALIILLYNPNDLFDIGFQLSFGAVYIILLIAPVLYRVLPLWVRFRWYGKPVMAVIISFIVQLGLFPLLAYYFGEVSLIGPLVNAFVIPLLVFIVPLALILLPVAMLFPAVAHLLNLPADFFLIYLSHLAQFSTALSWSWLRITGITPLVFVVWISALFFIASLPVPKLRWKMLSICLMIFCVIEVASVVHKLKPKRLIITFFDVGQGDAALINTPGGKHFLVDTGRWERSYDSAKNIILPHLKAEGINKLNAVFLSHPHADHIGGLPSLIRKLPIDTIYNSGTDYHSNLFKRYHQLARQHHLPVISLQAGDCVKLDPSIRLLIYGPEKSSHLSAPNNHSLIMELIYGQTEFLFMGDAEGSEEKQLVADYPNLIHTDFLKVGHHGSKTSSKSFFINAAGATDGLVSVAKHNRYHLPNAEAVRRLREDSLRLHFTSLEGALEVASDGNEIWAKR